MRPVTPLVLALSLFACAPPTEAPEAPCRRLMVGPAGSVVSLEGARLVVPEGAVLQTGVLELCLEDSDHPAVVGGQRWRLGPGDLELAGPVQLRLSHGSTGSTALVLPGPDGPWNAVGARQPVLGVWEGELWRPGAFWVEASDWRQVPYGSTPVPTDRVDVLWVLDNSCSFEQDSAYFAGLRLMDSLEQSGFDFHVGVTSTDVDGTYGPNGTKGRLRSFEGLRWVQNDTVDSARVFEGMVQMGTSGSASERGLTATYEALVTQGASANAGFERPDAHLAVIVVTDEPSSTRPGELGSRGFVEWLNSYKQGPTAAFYAAGNKSSGTYFEVAEQSGGSWFLGGEQVRGAETEDWTPILDPLVETLHLPVGHVLPTGALSVESWWVAPGLEPVPWSAPVWPGGEGTRVVWVDVGEAPLDEVFLSFELP